MYNPKSSLMVSFLIWLYDDVNSASLYKIDIDDIGHFLVNTKPKIRNGNTKLYFTDDLHEKIIKRGYDKLNLSDPTIKNDEQKLLKFQSEFERNGVFSEYSGNIGNNRPRAAINKYVEFVLQVWPNQQYKLIN